MWQFVWLRLTFGQNNIHGKSSDGGYVLFCWCVVCGYLYVFGSGLMGVYFLQGFVDDASASSKQFVSSLTCMLVCAHFFLLSINMNG